MKALKGYKTYIVAILLIIVAMMDVFTGDMTVVELLRSENVTLLLEGFGLAAVRHAIG